MATVKMINKQGKPVSDITLSDAVFGVEITPNAKAAMHTMVVNYLANKRQGTQSTLTRTEVRGGGRKPWRQKGTGRSRQGSIRSPQWKGGGVALGPKPRSYRFTVNKKLRRLAMKATFSLKLKENQLIVVEDLNLDSIKTKTMVEILSNIKAEGKTLIVAAEKNENMVKSAGNIPNVKTALVNTINVYDMLKYSNLVLTKDAVAKIEEVYA